MLDEDQGRSGHQRTLQRGYKQTHTLRERSQQQGFYCGSTIWKTKDEGNKRVITYSKTLKEGR